MIKWIETTGRTEEDAISAALFQLGLDRDDVSIEVIERAKSGFLGFGSNPAKVRVSYEEENGQPKPRKDLLAEELLSVVKKDPVPARKPAPKAEPKEETVLSAAPIAREETAKPKEVPAAPVEEETILAAKPGWQPKARQPRAERREQPRRVRSEQVRGDDEVLIGAAERPAYQEATLLPVDPEDERAQRIGQFLTGLLERLEVQAVPDMKVTEEGNYKIVLQGSDLGAIIGRRGETLDAIQQLTNYAVNHGQSKRVRVHIDAEGYRAKREESLQRLALKMAGKAIKYRKNMTMEPMNAYERHVIHAALQDYPGISTYSTGVEPNRRTVVAYTPGKK